MSPVPPSHRESARQRAHRIRLDYVRHLDSLTRFKLILTAAVALVAAACGVWIAAGSGRGQLSPGPVASVHRRWQHDCQACHASFEPLRDDASRLPARFLAGHPIDPGQAHTSATERCQTCHFAAPHHRLEAPAATVSCTACHREHAGESSDLRRVTDDQCTRCHASLAEHRSDRSAVDPARDPARDPAIGNVTGFTLDPTASIAGHPEFRSLRDDPGTIKFNHRLHLTAGLPAVDAAGRLGRPLKTLADLPASDIERYRQADQLFGAKLDQEYLVQLRCDNCHRTGMEIGGLASGSGRLAIPPSGAYYQPIEFQRDCRACHPLPFDHSWPTEQVPHGLKSADVRQFLGRFYASVAAGQDAAKKSPGDTEPWRPQRPVPGRSGDPTARAELQRTAAQQVRLAELQLRKQQVCAKCHDERPASSSRTKDAVADESDDDKLPPEIVPAGIPSVWLRHARFDHRPHFGLDCRECHLQAYPTDDATVPSDPSTLFHDRELVMIAGRDICLRCHSPDSADRRSGGVRNDCVLCHRYHDGESFASHDHSLSNPLPESRRSAPDHIPPSRRTISEWLAPPANRR